MISKVIFSYHIQYTISVYNSGNETKFWVEFLEIYVECQLVTLESCVSQQKIWILMKKSLISCQSHDTHYSAFYLGINSTVIPQTICKRRTLITYYSSVSILLQVVVWPFSGFIYLHILKWVQGDPASRI